MVTINNSAVRSVTATAYLCDETHNVVTTFLHTNRIVSIDITRLGESNKFFGFGITHKLNLKLIDINRELNITTDNNIVIKIDNTSYPSFFVTEVHRDEVTNELSITGYDYLYFLSNHTVSELDLPNAYSIKDFVGKVTTFGRTKYGLGSEVLAENNELLNISHEGTINFDGTETIREALTSASEFAGCVYYLTRESGLNKINFVPLGYNEEIHVDKDEYFTLTVKDNRKLAGITHATELGDNVSVKASYTGTTQVIRNNPFLELRNDVNTILETLFTTYGGMVMGQFNLEWRGSAEHSKTGVKLSYTEKNGDIGFGYLINDTIHYNGALKEKTEWAYDTTQDEELESNPSSLGEALKNTFARVDKVNKEITLVAQNVEEANAQISQIQIDTGEIKATVESNKEESAGYIDDLNISIDNLVKRVDASLSDEAFKVQIETAINSGVIDEVTTSTGFTFNEVGLTVSKLNKEMTTTITEDGMTVYKDDEALLVANNTGVVARNLHAETYLIIGENSRFEDFTNTKNEARTGCFWIGG